MTPGSFPEQNEAPVGSPLPETGAAASTAGQIAVSNGDGTFTWTDPSDLFSGEAFDTAVGGVSVGGGISGTVADATVTKIQGVAVSATAPASSDVLTATSGTAADWAAS